MPPVETGGKLIVSTFLTFPAGNVLRTDTTLKLSVRIPPHVSATEADAELKVGLQSSIADCLLSKF
jgi:hypothetical protein